ncbi:MAG: metal-dependent hydrolase [Planctomycetaceae bacterium]|nr:metal-dependent hydrolase [Planctomycetaceae bacterium]
MAGFKTHLTVSSIFGVGYGGAACLMYGVPWPTALLAGGLCGVSGMLPDIDSDSSRPLHESMAFAAAVVPMMLLHRFHRWGMSPELIILSGAGLYLLIRFGLGTLLKRYTVHRGMFHSLPAAAVFGELAYLLASGEDWRLRAFTAGAVVLGYVSHLVLDEIYSVSFSHGRLRLKSSFGTAMKLFGQSWGANLSAYAKLAILTAVILVEPQGQSLSQPGGTSSARQTATRLIDSVFHR